MKDILDYDLVKKPLEKESKLITVVYYLYCLGVSQHIIYSAISLISLEFSIFFFVFFQGLFILIALFFIIIKLNTRTTKLSKLSLVYCFTMLVALLII